MRRRPRAVAAGVRRGARAARRQEAAANLPGLPRQRDQASHVRQGRPSQEEAGQAEQQAGGQGGGQGGGLKLLAGPRRARARARARARRRQGRRQGRSGGWQARGRAPRGEEDDSANKRPRRATGSAPTYAGADSRSGTSSSEEDDFDAESEEASEAASDEVSSPGGSPGGAANASVYEGDEAETLEDLMADN